MNFRLSFASSIVLAVLFCFPPALRGQEGRSVDYARDVRPLLSRNCFVCHGPDPGSRESGLRLDRADSALDVLDSGQTAIVPGDPNASELMRRVTTSVVDERMPPIQSGHTLTLEEVEILRRWITEGAKYDDHWAFRRIDRPELPEVIDRQWPRNAIDRFILASLEARGIEASPEASKVSLIRRLSLDLIGLPPSPSEVAAFLDDDQVDAFERLVDRLFASPRFGERWGRQPIAALLKDLKRRGLLEDTLVVWNSEFGRTPLGENRNGENSKVTGRDHHPYAFSIWMAGGGVRGGQVIGATDDIAWGAVEDPVHVHDLQATILHLCGLDHTRLTYRLQGRDYRLTDVAGKVVHQVFS